MGNINDIYFEYVFYIGNEWDSTEICGLDTILKKPHYPNLVKRIVTKQG